MDRIPESTHTVRGMRINWGRVTANEEDIQINEV